MIILSISSALTISLWWWLLMANMVHLNYCVGIQSSWKFYMQLWSSSSPLYHSKVWLFNLLFSEYFNFVSSAYPLSLPTHKRESLPNPCRLIALESQASQGSLSTFSNPPHPPRLFFTPHTLLSRKCLALGLCFTAVCNIYTTVHDWVCLMHMLTHSSEL